MKPIKIMMAFLAALMVAGCVDRTVVEENIYQGTVLKLRDFSIASNQWTIVRGEFGDYFKVALEVPEITEDVVRYGNVMVSKKMDDGNTFQPLPLSEAKMFDGTSVSTYMDFEWAKDRVYVYYTWTDFYSAEAPDPVSLRVYVFADGSTTSGSTSRR